MQFFKSLNPFNLCIGTNNNFTRNSTNKTQKNLNTNFNNDGIPVYHSLLVSFACIKNTIIDQSNLLAFVLNILF